LTLQSKFAGFYFFHFFEIFMRFIFCVVLLSVCCNLHAQQKGILRGVVKEARTGETLFGATIQVSTEMSIGTKTDSEGRFEIALAPGKYQFTCGFLGLGSDTFTIQILPNQVTEKQIELNEISKILETIVVTAGKFEQKLEEQVVSMEILKPALIQNKNTTSIETALEQVPGLSIIDNDPQIRGGSGFTFGVGSRVAIVVDGIPLLSGDAGRPEWSYIPVENIEQVEVIKGASSVLYGSSALNGVIHIRSAYPRSKPKTSFNYSVGNYSKPAGAAESWYGKSIPGFTNLNFLHSRIIRKNLDFVVGGNLNMDQGYIGPPPPAPFMPEELKQVLKITDSIPTYSNADMLKMRARINFNLRYRSPKIKRLTYGVNGNGMLNKTNMVFAWLDDSLGLYRGYPGAVFMQNQSLFNLDPFVKYATANGITHSLTTRVFHSDNQISNNQSNRGTMFYGEYQLQRNFKTIDLNFTGGLVGNISTSFSQLYASSGQPTNRNVNVAGYFQIDKKMWQIVNFTGGIRYEYFKMNTQESVTAPIVRAGANIQLTKGTFLRVSSGQGFRYPTITERYIATKASLFGVFPNPDLKPEKSISYEMGLKQGFKIGSFMGYFDIAGFYQKYENTIEYLFGAWEPDIALIGFKFLNTGESRVRGIDCSIAGTSPESNKKFGLTALIGYTYVDPVSLTPTLVYAHDKSLGGLGQDLSYQSSSINPAGNVLKYRFKHLGKLDLDARIYKWNIGLSYRYYSKMQNIDRAFNDIEVLTSNTSPYLFPIKATNYWKSHKGYSILDARISYKFNDKQKIALICNNVFNVDYSLRPLKIEAPRTTSLQYIYTF
jgi:outer membrane cobalamin receptor